mmetsp:Transcript_60855/g.112916  ORF Transcript_60855/g.112916 Transcript_60855/m.112916 type:complete len:217 (+) Transcript_60855:81-731(+)
MARSSSCILAGLLALAFVASPAFVGFSPSKMPRMLDSTRMAQVEPQVQNTEMLEAPDARSYAGAAMSMVAALLVAFAPMAEAQAAKTGGRIGGTAPSAKPKPPPQRAAPAPAPVVKERVVEKTTIIRQAAPMGAAPVMMAPAPSMGDMIMGAAVQGVVGGAVSGAVQSAMAPHSNSAGPSGTDRMLEMQMRQDERQMDKQSNDIEDLKRQLAELKK